MKSPFNDYVDVTKFANIWRYPGGEVGVRLKAGPLPEKILARIHNSNDLMALVMILSALPEDVTTRRVLLPYLPYGRQDRVIMLGDPPALTTLARLLAEVHVDTLDVHSPTHTEEAFRHSGLTSHSALPWLTQYLMKCDLLSNCIIVAPDAGAVERATEAAAMLSVPVIKCEKTRDKATGDLLGFTVVEGEVSKLPPRRNLVIVDDICDGGGTFIGVAKALRARYGADFKLHLWVTHGIFSKGLTELVQFFDTIGCTDSFEHEATAPFLHTFPIQETSS